MRTLNHTFLYIHLHLTCIPSNPCHTVVMDTHTACSCFTGTMLDMLAANQQGKLGAQARKEGGFLFATQADNPLQPHGRSRMGGNVQIWTNPRTGAVFHIKIALVHLFNCSKGRRCALRPIDMKDDRICYISYNGKEIKWERYPTDPEYRKLAKLPISTHWEDKSGAHWQCGPITISTPPPPLSP